MGTEVGSMDWEKTSWEKVVAATTKAVSEYIMVS